MDGPHYLICYQAAVWPQPSACGLWPVALQWLFPVLAYRPSVTIATNKQTQQTQSKQGWMRSRLDCRFCANRVRLKKGEYRYGGFLISNWTLLFTISMCYDCVWCHLGDTGPRPWACWTTVPELLGVGWGPNLTTGPRAQRGGWKLCPDRLYLTRALCHHYWLQWGQELWIK